jgi:hypothetical protein
MPYDVLDTTRELIERAGRLHRRTTSFCQITVTNACPTEWGVVILVGGCKFFFSDDTEYTDGPKALDLRSGESATFITNKPEECVHQFFLALSVKAGDEPAQSLTKQEGVPEGQCLLHESITLGPKQRVAADALARREIYSLLELRRA